MITTLLESVEGWGGWGFGWGQYHRNNFMNNLHENYVKELGFELVTPGSAVRPTTDCTMEPGLMVN